MLILSKLCTFRTHHHTEHRSYRRYWSNMVIGILLDVCIHVTSALTMLTVMATIIIRSGITLTAVTIIRTWPAMAAELVTLTAEAAWTE